MAITITGANGEIINLADAPNTTSDRVGTQATALQGSINGAIAAGTATAFDVYPDSGNPDVATGVAAVGILQQAGTYQIPNGYEYLAVADDSEANSGAITINSDGFVANNINVLAGRESGLTYNASNESGQIINTAGSLNFNGSGKTGEWVIYTGDGNSSITATDGNNKINTGAGKNTVVLGTGNNTVYSQGQDTITGAATGYNTVTLAGSNSEVTLGETVLVNDSSTGRNNNITVGKNSTVFGGVSTTVSYNDGDQNRFQGGTNNTVSAASDASKLQVIHGTDNTYNVDQQLSLFNGVGSTDITVNGQFLAFGASASDYTLNAGGTDNGLFVADKGNETLSASGSSANLLIYAYSVSGAQSSFEATGGSGNDTLVAGTGNSTFTGGAGDNLFLFTKSTAENGNTVITDFANSSQNKIGLLDYGLDNDSLAQLLQTSQNDASGNAVLNLDGGHTVTIQGVSVSDLNANQFEIMNTPVQSA